MRVPVFFRGLCLGTSSNFGPLFAVFWGAVLPTPFFLFLSFLSFSFSRSSSSSSLIIYSPYNQRQDSFAQSVVRGDITDRNGNVLATTEVDEDGTETRTYPYGSLFSHVIGYNDSQFGKTGLESAQNFDLLTSNAFFMEKIQNEFKGEKDQGDTVVTTLDAELQQAAYDALHEFAKELLKSSYPCTVPLKQRIVTLSSVMDP